MCISVGGSWHVCWGLGGVMPIPITTTVRLPFPRTHHQVTIACPPPLLSILAPLAFPSHAVAPILSMKMVFTSGAHTSLQEGREESVCEEMTKHPSLSAPSHPEKLSLSPSRSMARYAHGSPSKLFASFPGRGPG